MAELRYVRTLLFPLVCSRPFCNRNAYQTFAEVNAIGRRREIHLCPVHIAAEDLAKMLRLREEFRRQQAARASQGKAP